LNGVSWPPNEKRKELSVDYIPVEEVPRYIEREESLRGQRFEIIYTRQQDNVIATHRISESRESHPIKLIDDNNNNNVTRTTSRKLPSPERPTIPTGPRADRVDTSTRESRVEIRGGEKVRVVRPDELFRKTNTKPWIYWMEVSEEVRERRRRK
jgi:hypothetical protein